VSKIVLNGNINFFLNCDQHFGKFFLVLFDKNAYVYIYFISKKYVNILTLEIANPGNRHCASCIGTLSFPIIVATGIFPSE